MSKHLEQMDRRAFLRGLMLTSAGLLVPKAVQVFVPAFAEPQYLVGIDPGLTTGFAVLSRCHAPFITTILASFGTIETAHTQSLFPNLYNIPKPA